MKGQVAWIAAALTVLCTGAMALDVRPATDKEIELALAGCWRQELTFQQRKVEELRQKSPFPSIPFTASACFDDGVVDSGWVGGDEGIEDVGTFKVSGGKLRLRGPGPSDAWIFGANELDCDVLMDTGRAMRLMNCVGVGADAGAAIADSSYELQEQSK